MGHSILGIDFSGDAEQWKARRARSNVWIAFAETDGPRLRVDDLKPVQQLAGDGPPFERLIQLLGSTKAVAGIDASFSVPRSHARSAALLWAEAAALAEGGRPFGRGRDLVAALEPDAGKNGVKLYRACEEIWRARGLNVRSGLWHGPRGGAAFSVACMTLLHRHKGPVWPFRPGGQGALLVETYPAAQLVTWGLSAVGYNGPKPAAETARLKIIETLARDHGLRGSDETMRTMAGGADALDAVLCAFAARAIAEGRRPRKLPAAARSEGWILVDDRGAVAAPTPAAPREEAEDDPLVSPRVKRQVNHLLDTLLDSLEFQAPLNETEAEDR
jgi:hypothetical protein